MSEKTAHIIITALSAAALVISVLLRSGTASTVLIVLCALMSLIVLYLRLPELSNVSADNPKLKTLRFATFFSAAVVIFLAGIAYLAERKMLNMTEARAAWLLQAVFAVLIIVFGNISPRLPFNRYTGLRLPWTVTDEETWIVAHRLLGYLSFPCGILCFAGADGPETALHIPVIMLFIWILIPAILSYIYYFRKYHVPRK